MAIRKYIRNKIFDELTNQKDIFAIDDIYQNRITEIKNLPCINLATKKEFVKSVYSSSPSKIYKINLILDVDVVFFDDDNYSEKVLEIILAMNYDEFCNDLRYKLFRKKIDSRGNQPINLTKLTFEIDYFLETETVVLDDLIFSNINYQIDDQLVTDYFKYRSGKYLLNENGVYLLLESGKKIVL